jgi:hypothetical protein
MELIGPVKVLNSFGENSGSHDNEYEDCCLLGCCAM